MTTRDHKSGDHMQDADDRLLLKAADWHEQGAAFALAIVIRTWGSSPRQAGAVMLVKQDGEIAGSVSGGCVEGAVIEASMKMMHTQSATRLDFGVADETAWEVGLSCGGQISVFVCASSVLEDGVIAHIKAALTSRADLNLICDLSASKVCLLNQTPPAEMQNKLSADETSFTFSLSAQPRLFIIGAGHISQHLAPMARQTGFDVRVIDPRATFANESHFGDIALSCGWPDEVLDAANLDKNSAVVTLTHDPKIDDRALHAALGRPVFHIACLGSTRTHAKRLERLKEAGFSQEKLAQIKGPAGLDIGAATPSEIAVSILADLIAARRMVLKV